MWNTSKTEPAQCVTVVDIDGCKTLVFKIDYSMSSKGTTELENLLKEKFPSIKHVLIMSAGESLTFV